ncbi:MAG TPA: uracil-DNA glycosylase family protein [Myxococcota bacterium]|nr:uracil-DNA glycosylase family protein [Myxococcota bacterium]
MPASRARALRSAARRLSRDVAALRFGAPVSFVYDPLDYARRAHGAYIDAYADSRKRVVFLGMNPGPFGMAQTGVPFGDVGAVRNFLRIETPVGRPAREHPKRSVHGFACARSEVSGTRLWGAIASHFGSPDRFFTDHFVANYCPLLFLEASGRNRTPDKLPASERDALHRACDRHLRRLVEVLEPTWVVGVGAFAEARAREALGDRVRVARVLHPSPASPLAHRDWAGTARRELLEQGVCELR